MIARVYADLIRKGLKTLESVPEAIREEVSKILNPDEENAGEEYCYSASGFFLLDCC